MRDASSLTDTFNFCGDWDPKTDFEWDLHRSFSNEASQVVLQVLSDLQLPAPEKDKDFMSGTEGPLMFLDRYGIVLRIEREDPRLPARRVDSKWVVQPIATIKAGDAIIELCPGCHLWDRKKDEKGIEKVRKKLSAEGVDFWDPQAGNIGYLPIKLPKFPHGIPVVIDRLAVNRLTFSISRVFHGLFGSKQETVRQAEQAYYAPFIKAFRDAWPEGAAQPPDRQRMKDFWSFCEDQRKKGVLATGWRQRDFKVDGFKSNLTEKIGRAYNELFQKYKP